MDCERRLAQTKADAWPEGVIARYLTVGGATVDIIEHPDDEPATIATCTGSGSTHIAAWDLAYYAAPIFSGYPERTSTARSDARRQAEREARTWAQEHASECRAIPKPGGTK
jgi:hypothetical protein